MADVKELIDLLKGKITKKEEDFIKKAYKFAEQAHIGQRRLNGEPYFSHVFETAKLLGKLRVGVNTIVAGLLHDLLEDTKVNEAELEKEFGKDVLFLVKGVTKLGTLKYRGHERHIESLRKFFVAMADDIRVLIIKFADRLHNLRTLSSLREDKRQRIAIESIEVYASLANRLGMGRSEERRVGKERRSRWTPYHFKIRPVLERRRRHMSLTCEWSSDVCSSDLDKRQRIAIESIEVYASLANRLGMG